MTSEAPLAISAWVRWFCVSKVSSASRNGVLVAIISAGPMTPSNFLPFIRPMPRIPVWVPVRRGTIEEAGVVRALCPISICIESGTALGEKVLASWPKASRRLPSPGFPAAQARLMAKPFRRVVTITNGPSPGLKAGNLPTKWPMAWAACFTWVLRSAMFAVLSGYPGPAP